MQYYFLKILGNLVRIFSWLVQPNTPTFAIWALLQKKKERKKEKLHSWKYVVSAKFSLYPNLQYLKHLGKKKPLQIAASLGKGKRVRKQVNYAEAEKGLVKLRRADADYDDDYAVPDKDGNYSDYAPSSGVCECSVECPKKDKSEKILIIMKVMNLWVDWLIGDADTEVNCMFRKYVQQNTI